MALRTKTQDDIWRAALSEFFSTLICVFTASGSATIVAKNLAVVEPTASLAVAIANAFALSTAVSFGTNISSGHVNPAVTFAGFVGGKLTWLRCVIFWFAQILGSVIACLLLKFICGGKRIPAFEFSSDMEVKNAVVLDMTRTIGFVCGVHRLHSRSRRNVLKAIILLFGLVVGANYLWIGLSFNGICMNPAAAFGPALVGWSWENHWVYWIGPLVGLLLVCSNWFKLGLFCQIIITCVGRRILVYPLPSMNLGFGWFALSFLVLHYTV